MTHEVSALVLSQRLGALEKSVDGIQKSVNKHGDLIVGNDKRLALLEKTIKGNGAEGMYSIVKNLKKEFDKFMLTHTMQEGIIAGRNSTNIKILVVGLILTSLFSMASLTYSIVRDTQHADNSSRRKVEIVRPMRVPIPAVTFSNKQSGRVYLY